MEAIASHFAEIMKILGLDLNDDSLQGTPRRVAKMYVQEIFKGLDPENKPEITLFKNTYGYDHVLLEKYITVKSFCEHHFVPITGHAHVAYVPGKHVIGLSKLNRIVDYYSRRPQVQERLTNDIANELQEVLGTEDVAVQIVAEHMCVSMRGVEHEDCNTTTSFFGGRFKEDGFKTEFLHGIKPF